MRISDWSSDVCSSDLDRAGIHRSGCKPAESRPCGSSAGHAPRRLQRVQRYPIHTDRPNEGKYPLHRAQWPWLSHLLNPWAARSEEHTSELQSLMRISYAVFCLKKKTTQTRKIY